MTTPTTTHDLAIARAVKAERERCIGIVNKCLAPYYKHNGYTQEMWGHIIRRIKEDKDVKKDGDAIPGVLKAEVTLIVDNEAAHGVAADLYGMTASS